MRKWMPENLEEFNKGKKGQVFKKEKWIRCGKEIDVDKFIQENREDTELIPALKKYGCIPASMIDTEKVYGDLLEIKNLKDKFAMIDKSKDLFNELPSEIKQEFNNDIKEFVNRGADYLKSKMNENKTTQTETVKEEGAKNE